MGSLNWYTSFLNLNWSFSSWSNTNSLRFALKLDLKPKQIILDHIVQSFGIYNTWMLEGMNYILVIHNNSSKHNLNWPSRVEPVWAEQPPNRRFPRSKFFLLHSRNSLEIYRSFFYIVPFLFPGLLALQYSLSIFWCLLVWSIVRT